jgi:uncharacterized protein
MCVRADGRFCVMLVLAFVLPCAAHAQLVPTSSGSGQDCDQQTTGEAGKLVFLTGPTDGTYFKVGGAIADIARAHGLSNLQVRCSNRTFENMRQLKAGGAAFALVQSDVAHAFWYGHTRYPQDQK